MRKRAKARGLKRTASAAVAVALSASMVLGNLQSVSALAETQAEAPEQSAEESTADHDGQTTAEAGTESTEKDNSTTESSAGETEGQALAVPEKTPSADSTTLSGDRQGEIRFGTNGDVDKADVYSEEKGIGFSDVSYPEPAKGWSGNVYSPRAEEIKPGSEYVTDSADYLQISSKVWAEKGKTPDKKDYSLTYENTSTLDVKLENGDYQVTVSLVNPTGADYSAYLEAEDITKLTGVSVPAGQSKEVEFRACLVDGVLNLKFLAESTSLSEADAALKSVYVSSVKLEKAAQKPAAEKPTIFLASDSTVQTYEKKYEPQTGWGETLCKFFGEFVQDSSCDDCNYSQSHTYETANVVIENRAIGGRSSRSFIQEGKLDDLLEDIKPGDYVLLQWGHNDSTGTRPERYVAPEDFGKWIQYYIDGAVQRGATPVLVTPVARYSYKTNSDGTLDSFQEGFKAYGDIMRKIAAEQNIPLVDLSKASIELCNEFGISGAESLFLHVTAGDYPESVYAGGYTDDTHLQYFGAYKFSQCVARGIQEMDLSSFSADRQAALSKLQGYVDLNLSATEPEAVTGLQVVTAGSTSVSLKWDSAAGAERYYVYRAELADGQTVDSVDFSQAEKYSVSANPRFQDNKCNGGKTYVYAVRGYNDKGLGPISEKVSVTTKSAKYKYDFGLDSSPVMDGWTKVTRKSLYNKENGFGWKDSASVPEKDRYRSGNGNPASNAMADDFTLGAGEFLVDLPNGQYEVTMYAGDLLSGTSTIKSEYTIEGKSAGAISVKLDLGSVSSTVEITDGQMNLVIGGENAYLNGLEITPVLLAPQGFSYSEKSISGDTASFLIGWNKDLDPADTVAWNVYRKSWADADFTLVKSFTAEEYAVSDLDCRSMTAPAGGVYEYYMTAVTAGGTESVRSNVIEIVMLDTEMELPGIPQNVKCVKAENGNIQLAWDAVDTAFRYEIYRSDRAEGQKGFKEYVKVGDSGTNGWTDTDPEATVNMHWYYKVLAVNAGGSGELSEACQSPVTEGALVAAPAEVLSDRALVAINLAGDNGGETVVTATDKDGNAYTSGVYLSWRSFEGESATTYTVYRNGQAIAENISVTNLVDEAGTADDVYKVVGSTDSARGLKAPDTQVWKNKYLELQLYQPANQTMPDGTTCSYTANDMSVGDLDGDGQLELFVKWYPTNAQDNSKKGYTGTTFIDAYDVNFSTGAVSLKWRLNMGVNLRSGAHYTQFLVWDFDGDGKAELAVKTADGTTMYTSADGTDQTLTYSSHVGAVKDTELSTDTLGGEAKHDYRDVYNNPDRPGYVLAGPEYFTMYNCDDGSEIDTVDYDPGRGTVSSWGDSYGGRVDRFLACVAYLNGRTPSAVFCRGYYTRTCLTAYNLVDTDGDGVGDQIQVGSKFDSDKAGKQYAGQGNHNLAVADVDNDGRDEIIYGSLTLEHDLTVKYTTGLKHGDAMHVSDWVPWNPGLEVMQVHEDIVKYDVEIHDAETGEILMGYAVGKDTGRGVAGDIDPTAPGAEFWAIAPPSYVGSEPSWNSRNGGVYSTASTLDNLVTLSEKVSPASNFTIYWDGDLLCEMLDHEYIQKTETPVSVVISKWDYENNKEVDLLNSKAIFSSNGTKGNPGLAADILGDWRDEIICRSSADDSKIRIYSTTIQTDYVVPCALENRAYREAVAWQNVGYNQPAHTDYLVSEGLVTAQLTAEHGKSTPNSVSFSFTPANDGVNGHEVTGYEVYRAGADGVYTKIGTVDAGNGDQEAVEYRFDFGSQKTQEGWTKINAKSESFETSGTYGFTEASLKLSPADKKYSADTGELKDMYNDCVLFSVSAGDETPAEFAVKVPNGTYTVTVHTMNGSGSQYNQFAVEGTALEDIRLGNSVKNTETALTVEVEVTDGVLNITNTSSKTAQNGFLYFSGLEISRKADPAPTAYSYTDTGLEAGTYSYKVAAVVDGKTSYMSRPVNLSTAEEITEKPEFTVPEFARGIAVEKVLETLGDTVKVENGQKEVDVTWDLSKADLNQVGTYDITAYVAGYGPVALKLTVIENYVESFTPVKKVQVTIGTAVEEIQKLLPTEVEVLYANKTSEKKTVVWDLTQVEIEAPAVYTVKGTVEGLAEQPEMQVEILKDYVKEVGTINPVAVEQGEDYTAKLPAQVTVNTALETGVKTAVKWDVENSPVDLDKAGTYTVNGILEEYGDYPVQITVRVDYKSVYKFDFGIDSKRVADGWTGITVNKKGGTNTADKLGVTYTKEKGYGFLDGSAKIQGRTEEYTFGDGTVPKLVYTDFALTDGQTFVADVPNGKYQVEMIGGTNTGSSTVKGTLNGTVEVSIKNSKNEYTVGIYEVTVTDGKISFETTGSNSRLCSMVIRTMGQEEVDTVALEAAIARAEALNPEEWTAESYALVQKALEKAKGLLENGSQDEVTQMAQELNDLIDALAPAETEPESSTEETEPSESESSTDLTEPSESESSTDVTEPSETESSTDATEPSETESSTDATEPSETESSTDATEPSETESSTDVTEPSETESSTDATEPSESESSSDATEPGESESSSSDAEIKIDTAGLEKAIGRAEALKASDYTSESYAKMKAALEAAKKAMTAKTQKEVDAATKALNEAIEALVSSTPGTGDATGARWFVLVTVIALMAVIGSAAAMEIAARKRKKNN